MNPERRGRARRRRGAGAGRLALHRRKPEGQDLARDLHRREVASATADRTNGAEVRVASGGAGASGAATGASPSRAIITSVDLMIASASSPRRSFSSVERIGGDDRGQRLIANPQADLAEQAVDAHFFDEAAQAIAAAERDDQPGRPLAAPRPAPGRRRLPREQAIDFRLRQAVMAARRRASSESCPERSIASASSSRCPSDRRRPARLAAPWSSESLRNRLESYRVPARRAFFRGRCRETASHGSFRRDMTCCQAAVLAALV